MRRRDFIKAITALSAGWPLTARAQQVDRVRHIGILNPTAENWAGLVAATFGSTFALAAPTPCAFRR